MIGEKDIITELFITDKWIEIETMRRLYMYIYAYIYIHTKCLFPSNLSCIVVNWKAVLVFQWQAILVGPRQDLFIDPPKTLQILVFCGRPHKHQKNNLLQQELCPAQRDPLMVCCCCCISSASEAW